MTIRQQLGASFLLFVALFAANLAVHSWAGARRAGSLETLRQATERRALVVALERELDDRVREAAVIEHVALEPAQIDDLSGRLDRVVAMANNLGALAAPEDRQAAGDLGRAIDALVASWRRFYESRRGQPPSPRDRRATEVEGRARLLAREDVATRLDALRAGEEKRTDRATVSFRRVSAVTDRVGLAIFVVTLGAALLVSAWLWRRIASSLARLKEGAARLSAGQMSYRIELTSGDELGDLAQSFDAMAASLSRALDEAGEARAAAERANKAKSAFLANMTHEFRTPMTAILGYADLLRQEAEERELDVMAADAGNIESAGRHLLTLVNDLLDLARIESGRMTLSIEEFDLEDLVRAVVSTLHPLVEQHGNRLDLDLPVDVGAMTADPVKVRQTLFNLVGNAAKFTDAGTIRLAVERRDQEAGERIRFTVSDTGIGIASDRLERIFEEYEQADGAVARKYGGTGLGLAITRRFCRMMGGEISVASEPGRGTTFVVDLPAVVKTDPRGAANKIVALPTASSRARSVPEALSA